MSKYFNKQRIVILLSALSSDHNDLTKLFKLHGIQDYVYTIETKYGVVKHGESANTIGPNGERLYRQLGHLLGWERRLTGSSGAEMRIVAEEYEKMYGEPLTRNDVTVRITDLTGVPYAKDECVALERCLINESIKTDGRAPIGNSDATTKRIEMAEHNLKRLTTVLKFDE
jgi:hypothetical protein